jgi:hypothetical protein
MVIEHYKEIFSESAIFFDPQTMKTQIGIEGRNDGIVLVPEQNRWYILEVELSRHPLHEHIIPQITRFSIAYEEEGTRKKIRDTLYNAIKQDIFKKAVIENQNEDPYKMLTDLIDTQPTIAIIIDQKTPELDRICKKLPFPTQTIDFKTYKRENVGIGVHIHEFQPLGEKKEKTERHRIRLPKEGPQKLTQVLEVAELVFKGEELSKAFKNVSEQHEVHISTVRDKCTRQLDLDMGQFRELVQDKRRFVTFLRERYPEYQNMISEKLS